MKARLKFRVWDKVFNSYWSDKEIKENASWLLFPDNENIHNVEIEQCSGLKDKNGKFVFEGDVLGCYEGYVKWCDHCKSFNLFFGDECAACNGDVLWSEVVEDDGKLEVIGNINKNPELAK